MIYNMAEKFPPYYTVLKSNKTAVSYPNAAMSLCNSETHFPWLVDIMLGSSLGLGSGFEV